MNLWALILLYIQLYKSDVIEFFSAYGKDIHSIDLKEEEIIGKAAGTGSNDKPILRLSGKVMKGPINIYLLFYGSQWSWHRRYKIINFIKHLDQTSYFSMMKNYRDDEGNVTGPLILQTAVWKSYDAGLTLQPKDIFNILQNSFPEKDLNGIYIFLADNKVNAKVKSISFCSDFCGYHSISNWRKVFYLRNEY